MMVIKGLRQNILFLLDPTDILLFYNTLHLMVNIDEMV